MTILLCGSNGQLGKSILISSKNKDNIIQINKKDLDISDFKRAKFYFEKYKPSIVINAAGYTNVDKAETEKEKAYKANCLGPKNLAYFANTPHLYLDSGNIQFLVLFSISSSVRSTLII